MNEIAYRIGLRLAQIGFFRRAIDDRADLKPFQKRPTFRILLGIFMIAFSFLMCWPAIGALAGIAIHQKMPLLIVVGGPLLYGLSHLCYLTGMALSGAEYSWIFLRWAIRITVEALLNRGLTRQRADS